MRKGPVVLEQASVRLQLTPEEAGSVRALLSVSIDNGDHVDSPDYHEALKRVLDKIDAAQREI